MAKVYVVTAGCYSDYHIVRCFSDKVKAELYVSGLSGYDVEEFEMDEPEPEVLGCKLVVARTGEEIRIERIDEDPDAHFLVRKTYPGWVFNFWFPPNWDDTRCRKVAKDSIAQWTVKFGDQLHTNTDGQYDRLTMERRTKVVRD